MDISIFYGLFSSLSSTDLTLLESMETNPIFNVAVLLILGLLGGKLVHRFGLPKVTGYILVGVLIGPSVLGFISHDMVKDFTIIRQVAIGFIGYTIGLELKFRKMKKTGKQVAIITISQALVTFVLVTLAVVLVAKEHNWTYGLILGAIATATAPAPIIAVVKNYRTKGPVTDVLLPLVALDDAVGIMLFAVMLSLGESFLLTGNEVLSLAEMIWAPTKEILLSVGIGGTIGYILSRILIKLNREEDNIVLMVILGAVFLGIGIGQIVHASAILLPMTIGVVLANVIDDKYEHRLTKLTDLFIAPILLAFFTIAGAELNIGIIPTVGTIGVVYIVVRVIGKVSGSHFSAKAVKAPPTVTKYLGWTLIPQAGVAIDMALTADLAFVDLVGYEYIGQTIMTIVLAATLFYEVFGLIVVKTALQRAGEIHAGEKGWDN
ncbi:MAG: cation:proton antiporter [Candidatus Izemoplasma sp.]